jgi:hypothetical protein
VKLSLPFMVFLLVSITLCSSCGHLPNKVQSFSKIFSPQLEEAFGAYDKTMSERRTPLRFESGRVVDTCNAYLQEAKVSSIYEGVNNEIISQEYLVCPSVAVLQSAARSATTAGSINAYGRELCDRLDFMSFASSLRPRVDDTKRVLSALDNPLETDKYSCSFSSRDWFLKVEVVAEADFTEDGKTDWLVWVFDEAKTGNYRGYAVLLLSDVSKPGLLTAKTLP